MTNTINELGQPVGFDVKNFIAPIRPDFTMHVGNFVRIEPISMVHVLVVTHNFQP